MTKHTHDVVKQPNAVTSAIYNFSRNQKRVFYVLLQAIANKELNKVKGVYECKIKHQDYATLFETDNASREISAAFESFDKKGGANSIILLNPEEDVGDDLGKSTITIVVKSEHKPKSGYSSFQILEETFDILKSTDNKFTMFLLSYAGKLQNPYAMRLYETICQWKNTCDSRKIACAWMRSQYVMPKSYNLSSNFRNKFLVPAVREITEKTNIKLTYEELYEGERKNSVSHIHFKWLDSDRKTSKQKVLIFETTLEQAVKTYTDLINNVRLPSVQELENIGNFLLDLGSEGFDLGPEFWTQYKAAMLANKE
jgi:plasmid replication initiation protein